MKYLQDYMENKQTELFNKTNAFFAFSMEQFNEQKKEGITYVNLKHGMICDKRYVKALIDGLDAIYKDSIAQDLADHGKERVISRELSNHECYYTWDIEPCVSKLQDYPITRQEIAKVFAKNIEKNQDY